MSRRAASPRGPSSSISGGTAPRRRISASACDIAKRETWLVIGIRSAS